MRSGSRIPAAQYQVRRCNEKRFKNPATISSWRGTCKKFRKTKDPNAMNNLVVIGKLVMVAKAI